MIRAKKDKSNNSDTCSNPVAEEMNLCPLDIGNVLTSEGALARPFLVNDFVGAKKRNLHIRGYVDFYGGYAGHTREVIFGLEKTGLYDIKLSPIKSPIDIHPALFSRLQWYVNNPCFDISKSIFLVIAGPGHLQKEFLPTDRIVIGWTMIETRRMQPRLVEWCNNANLILCPTEIDYRRFKESGVKSQLATVRIGYDGKLFHPGITPIDIVSLRNRYVFGVVGSWNYRKGVEEIVQAYCNTFTKDDPVSLLLVCKYGNRPYGEYQEDRSKWSIRLELNACIAKLGLPANKLPHISVLDVPIHPEVLPHVYSRIDCLVGFSSGESTWLPGLELGAMKKPIIQLNNECCGYMEYMEGARYLCKEVSYRRCDDKLAVGTSAYYEGEEMGFGDIQELGDKMNQVYEERGTAEQRLEIDNRYASVVWRTWENSMIELQSYLDLVYLKD
jgi:glycosyltransferase involved in cell wall biosynthesis